MRIRGYLFLTCAMAVASSAAQAPTVWTYQDCVDYARSHNIQLMKSRLDEQVAGYSLEGAKAQWQPTLDFGTSHTYSNAPWGNGDKNSLGGNFNLNAGWTVYNGGIRENNIRLNEKQVEIQRLATTELFRTIETDLLTVYLNILYAKESIDIFEEAVQLSQAQTDRARQLMEAGKISRVDYAQLKAQLEQDNYNLVNARGQYATRTMELKKLLQLGLTDSISVAPVDWERPDIMAPLPPIEDSYNLAILTDAQLQSLDLQKDAADINVAIAKAGRAPQIGLNAGIGTSYRIPGENFGSQLRTAVGEQIGISFSIPIFDQKKTKVAVAKANAEKLGILLDTDQRRLDLSQALETSYIDVREAQSRYLAAEEQEKASAMSNELVNEQFTLGLVNPVELLTAHNALLEARHSVLQSKYMAILGFKMIDFYRTAEIQFP